MNKKRGVLSVIAFTLIVFIFLGFRMNIESKTIEEAINEFDSIAVNILHIEKMEKGYIVFADTITNDYMYTFIVRKTISGYKVVYSGIEGDINLVASKFGLTKTYFPNIEKTSLPVYFGVIGNEDVQQVMVKETKRNIESQAKIIETEGGRIWFLEMSQFEGSEFEIIGLLSEGKEVVRINDDISPYSAEQKPFKSNY